MRLVRIKFGVEVLWCECEDPEESGGWVNGGIETVVLVEEYWEYAEFRGMLNWKCLQRPQSRSRGNLLIHCGSAVGYGRVKTRRGEMNEKCLRHTMIIEKMNCTDGHSAVQLLTLTLTYPENIYKRWRLTTLTFYVYLYACLSLSMSLFLHVR